jgi:uncharacterized membrane protein
MLRRIWSWSVHVVRLYFMAGLLAFAPIAITFWAIAWIIQQLDSLLLPRVLAWLSPGAPPPDLPPLVGAIFTFIVILLAGVVVRHLFGHELVRVWERILSRVPVARTIYGGVKQLFEAIVHSGTASYKRVVLVEYPRRGIWCLAFTTGRTRGTLQRVLPEQSLINCFLPTTPNPTSGFFIVVPESDLVEIDMSVEEAFKIIMSAGLVTPSDGIPPKALGIRRPASAAPEASRG